MALTGTLVPASSGTAAAALGSISGQMLVTGGAPIAGAEVTLYLNDDGDIYDVDDTETDATGTYHFTGVEAGTYRLGFVDPTGDHATEYWSNWSTLKDADDLYVAPGAALTGKTVVVTTAGHVTGVVTGAADAPLAYVTVAAYRHTWPYDDTSWELRGETTTSADGSYDLGGLPGGSYRLGFTDEGATYLPEFWDDAATVGAARDVVVREGQVTAGKDARLARGGLITGSVSGSGGPLADVGVTAYVFDTAEGEWTWYTSTVSDETGTYRLGGLPTDSYRLRFRDDASVHLTEFWDDATSLAAATSVPVVAGETVTGKDADLALGGRISGTVRGAGGAALDGVFVYAQRTGGSEEFFQATTDADGAFELQGLPSGQYVVGFYDFTDSYLSELWDDAQTWEEATPVTVTAGQTVTGLDAELALAATITGSVSGPAFVDWVWVSAYEKVAGEWEYVNGTYVEDGAYRLGGLPGGTYRLAFEDDFGSLVTEYWNDKSSLDLADDITVAPGGMVGGKDAVLRSSQTPVPVPTTPVPTPTPTPTAPVPAPPVTPDVAGQLTAVAKALKVKGKPVVGRTVKVTNAVAELRTRVGYAFQWYAGAKKVKKATASRLKVTKALRGKVLKVKVTLSAGGAKKVVTLKVGRVR